MAQRREGTKEPTKYWLSTLPADITFERLVDLAKLRWRIERDYQEVKQELGLSHFEGELARLPSPCHDVHRSLQLPDLRDPEAPPVQTERHVPSSITTMRHRLIIALIRRAPRCPCCARRNVQQKRLRL